MYLFYTRACVHNCNFKVYKYLYIHNVQRLPFFFRTVMWDQSVGVRVEKFSNTSSYLIINTTLRMFAYLRENSHTSEKNHEPIGSRGRTWCLPGVTVVLPCARLTCLTAPPQFYNKHFLTSINFSIFLFLQLSKIRNT